MHSNPMHASRLAMLASLTLCLALVGCESGSIDAGRDSGTTARTDAGSRPVDGAVTPGTDSGSEPTTDSGTTTPGEDSGTTTPGEDAGTTVPPEDAGTSPTAVWRPFTDSSPWNTPIADDVALRPDSDALIEHMRSVGAGGVSLNIAPWSVPLYYVDSSTPRVTVHAGLSNEGENHDFSWPVPADAEPAAELDGHLLLVDLEARQSYDFYQASHRSDGNWDCTLCATSDMNGDGIRPPSGGPTPWYESHGSRACGYPLVAGLVRTDEIRAGRIDHALVIAYPGIRQGWFVSPASTGHPNNGIVSPDRGVPCGGHIQLDPDLDLDSLGLAPGVKVIARALQEYGAYVGDFSGSISLYADGSPEARAQWPELLGGGAGTNAIPFESLRVVEWGTLTRGG